MLLLLTLGCSPDDIPTAKDTGAHDSGGPDTDTDTEGPTDLDGDGHPAETDCNDTNVHVHPGAEEAWNDVDDDCDGIIDADGAWTGTMDVGISTVYEGRPYTFALDCPFVGTRAAGVLDYAITCTTDADDVNAARMIGATLILTPDDASVTGDTWADTVVATSANGWDTDGDGQIAWSDYGRARVSLSVDRSAFDLSGEGDITRE